MAGVSEESSFEIDDLVEVNGKRGYVKFIGSVHFTDGEWVGIALDEPEGKNDGTVKGQKYFECPPNHGLLLKPNKLKLIQKSGDLSMAELRQQTSSRVEALKQQREAVRARVMSRRSTGSSSNRLSLDASSNRRKSMIPRHQAPKSGPDPESEPTARETEAKVHALEAQLQTSMEECKHYQDVIEQMKQDRIRSEHAAPSSQLESLQTEKEELEEKYRKEQEDHRQEITDLTQKVQLSQMHQLLDDVRGVLGVDEGEELDLEKIGEMVLAYHKQGQSILQLEEDKADLVDRFELLTLDKEQLEVEKELAEEKALDAELQQSKLEDQLASLKEELEAMKSQAMALPAASEDSDDLGAQNQKLRLALAKLREITTQEKSELNRELTHLRHQTHDMAQLQQDKQQAEDDVARLKATLEEVTEQLEATDMQDSMFEQLTNKNMDLEEQVAGLQEQLQDLEQMRDLAEEMEQQQSQFIESLQVDMERYRQQLHTANAEIERLREESASKDKSVERAVGAVQQLKQQISTFQELFTSESDDSGDALAELSRKLHTGQKKLADARKGIRSLLFGLHSLSGFVSQSQYIGYAFSQLVPVAEVQRHGDLINGLSLLHLLTSFDIALRTNLPSPYNRSVASISAFPSMALSASTTDSSDISISANSAMYRAAQLLTDFDSWSELPDRALLRCSSGLAVATRLLRYAVLRERQAASSSSVFAQLHSCAYELCSEFREVLEAAHQSGEYVTDLNVQKLSAIHADVLEAVSNADPDAVGLQKVLTCAATLWELGSTACWMNCLLTRAANFVQASAVDTEVKQLWGSALQLCHCACEDLMTSSTSAWESLSDSVSSALNVSGDVFTAIDSWLNAFEAGLTSTEADAVSRALSFVSTLENRSPGVPGVVRTTSRNKLSSVLDACAKKQDKLCSSLIELCGSHESQEDSTLQALTLRCLANSGDAQTVSNELMGIIGFDQETRAFNGSKRSLVGSMQQLASDINHAIRLANDYSINLDKEPKEEVPAWLLPKQQTREQLSTPAVQPAAQQATVERAQYEQQLAESSHTLAQESARREQMEKQLRSCEQQLDSTMRAKAQLLEELSTVKEKAAAQHEIMGNLQADVASLKQQLLAKPATQKGETSITSPKGDQQQLEGIVQVEEQTDQSVSRIDLQLAAELADTCAYLLMKVRHLQRMETLTSMHSLPMYDPVCTPDGYVVGNGRVFIAPAVATAASDTSEHRFVEGVQLRMSDAFEISRTAHQYEQQLQQSTFQRMLTAASSRVINVSTAAKGTAVRQEMRRLAETEAIINTQQKVVSHRAQLHQLLDKHSCDIECVSDTAALQRLLEGAPTISSEDQTVHPILTIEFATQQLQSLPTHDVLLDTKLLDKFRRSIRNII